MAELEILDRPLPRAHAIQKVTNMLWTAGIRVLALVLLGRERFLLGWHPLVLGRRRDLPAVGPDGQRSLGAVERDTVLLAVDATAGGHLVLPDQGKARIVVHGELRVGCV